jgi:hypothetical protein
MGDRDEMKDRSELTFVASGGRFCEMLCYVENGTEGRV